MSKHKKNDCVVLIILKCKLNVDSGVKYFDTIFNTTINVNIKKILYTFIKYNLSIWLK